MKKTSRAQAKEKTRDLILRAAAKLIKQNGIEKVSIDQVMDEVNLTRGSFYAYFKSKDDLVLKCSAWAIRQANIQVSSALRGTSQDMRFEVFLNQYLSVDHAQNLSDGCPVAALSREISLSRSELRRSFALLLSETIDERRTLMKPEDRTIDRKRWIGLMSTYVGALILSRACAGEKLADEILESAKFFLLSDLNR